MLNNYLIKIILFIVIFLILFLINRYFFTQKKENFGTYCGSYNLGLVSNQSNCISNSECQWNPYTSKSGTVGGYCTNHS